MKKTKFGSLNFDSIEILERKEMGKIKGGYGETPPFFTMFRTCLVWRPSSNTYDSVLIVSSTGQVVQIVEQNVSPGVSQQVSC
jgi:hypothetical protein